MTEAGRHAARAKLLRRLAALFFLLLFAGTVWKQGQTLRESQRAAERIQTHAKAILDALPVAVISCDEHGIVTTCNAEAETLLGWRSRDLLGRAISDILPRDESRRHRASFLRAVQRLQQNRPNWQQTNRVQGNVIKADGSKLLVEVRMRGIAHDDTVEFLAVIAPLQLTPDQQNSPYEPKAILKELP